MRQQPKTLADQMVAAFREAKEVDKEVGRINGSAPDGHAPASQVG
jgi:hypothetical protein